MYLFGISLLSFLLTIFNLTASLSEKNFVIVIPSYNNELYAESNIRSCINQNYNQYRIVFINDCSTDKTLEIVKKVIKETKKEELVTIVDNKTRNLGLKNYYIGITDYTNDNEIVLTLDGDDRLFDNNVLTKLNKVYSNPNKTVWMTFGSFVLEDKPGNFLKGWLKPISNEIIKRNSFRRRYPYIPSHLRTFYSWLFKKVQKKDLLYKNQFYEAGWDAAMMFPMIEMCGDRFEFVEEPLYIYNIMNENNDFKTKRKKQLYFEKRIRKMVPYKKLGKQ